MSRNPKQYLLVHWDYSKVSMVEMTAETIRAYQLLFRPDQLWRLQWAEDGRALCIDNADATEIDGPKVEIISHRTRQRMIERGFPKDAAANDNAALSDEIEAMLASE